MCVSAASHASGPIPTSLRNGYCNSKSSTRMETMTVTTVEVISSCVRGFRSPNSQQKQMTHAAPTSNTSHSNQETPLLLMAIRRCRASCITSSCSRVHSLGVGFAHITGHQSAGGVNGIHRHRGSVFIESTASHHRPFAIDHDLRIGKHVIAHALAHGGWEAHGCMPGINICSRFKYDQFACLQKVLPHDDGRKPRTTAYSVPVTAMIMPPTSLCATKS